MRFCLFLLLLIPFLLEAAGNDAIVVWRLEPKTGVSEKDADAVSAMVTTEVGRVSGRQTIGETDMKALMVGEEKKLSCGAEDTACVAEIGAALGAPESVTGTLSKLGDYWILSLQRLNVRSVSVLGRSERKVKGSLNLLVEAIAPAVAELFGKTAAAPPSQNEPAYVGPATYPGAYPDNELPPNEYEVRTLSAFGWSLIGTGAAIVIFGGVSHWQMNEANDRYALAGAAADKKSFELWRGLSIAGYTVGSVAVATGVALMLFDAFYEPESPAMPTALILPTPDGAYLSLGWRW